MKKEILFILFLFFVSSCFAQEISFQRESYSPSETIIGSVSNVISPLSSTDIKIYEGRREVFFEKGILKVNQTYYFYIIPTKEGDFSLKLNNLLYDNSGIVSSINLEKNFSIKQINNSPGFGIRPGVYEGENPEIVITNLKPEKINVSVDKIVIGLGSFESKKVILNVSDGFFLYKIGEYNLPLLKFGSPIKNETNFSVVNESYLDCLVVNVPPFFSIATGEFGNYSIEVQNNCSANLENVIFSSTYTETNFYKNNFTINIGEISTINFGLTGKSSGEYSENISLTENGRKISLIPIQVYCFENKTNLENFNQAYDNPAQKNCSSLNGKFCGDKACSSEEGRFYDISAGQMCCLSECVDLNAKPTNWLNIVMATMGILVIGAVGYFLFKRAKGLKAPKAEDKFKEAEKKYDKNISGKK